MGKCIVSVCHGLTLVPVEQIMRFGRRRMVAVMATRGEGERVGEVPGTLTVTHTVDSGIFSNKITFKVSAESFATVARLERFNNKRLVAVYIDPRGNRRVCGSPDHPMTFTCRGEDGALDCEMTGQDNADDAYLMAQ